MVTFHVSVSYLLNTLLSPNSIFFCFFVFMFFHNWGLN
jgi:hypothetical protein